MEKLPFAYEHHIQQTKIANYSVKIEFKFGLLFLHRKILFYEILINFWKIPGCWLGISTKRFTSTILLFVFWKFVLVKHLAKLHANSICYQCLLEVTLWDNRRINNLFLNKKFYIKNTEIKNETNWICIFILTEIWKFF